MDDIIKEYFTELNDIILIISAIFALRYFRKYRKTEVRFFIYYMLYVAVVDVIGSYTWYVYKYEDLHFVQNALKGTLMEKNYWWFTIFWNFGSAVFLSFYFFRILRTKLFKQIVKVAAVLFALTFLGHLVFNIQALFTSQIQLINILGGIVIINCIVLYFIEILTSDRILNFVRSFNSIVSSTLFIWWLIITPLIFYDVYFSAADWNFVILRHQVFFFANLFMYSMFSFALVWCKPKYDS